jgi:murein DD-endopeptidase MepM/ murein hydrolase activator NlpD
MLLAISLFSSEQVQAYSLTKDRPVFLAWPLPSYIGVARISQFPNTPWTWNYLGLNPGMQCTPAFGYLEAWLPTWRDTSISWEQDAAQADPHQFQMIECYSTGGEAGTNGHEATDIKAAAGTPALASAEGKVAGWRLNDLNSLLVLKHCLGGKWDSSNECAGGVKWYTTYMHIIVDPELQKMDLDVKEGAPVGTIYNQGDNSHLHFEVGLNERNYANYVNPWGRDEAPWIGCMWKDESICVQSNPGYERYLFSTPNGRMFLKQDNIAAVEIHHIENADQVQLYGDRMAMLMKGGTLFVTDKRYGHVPAGGHDFTFNWVKVADQVTAFQVTAHRLAVLNGNGILQVQDGPLAESWELRQEGVKSFSISDHRVGVLTQDGRLKVMEGDLDAQWMNIAENVAAFQLIDSRIAVLDPQGNLTVQEGPLTFEWKAMGTAIKSFQLSGTRVAVVNNKNELWVNDGNLRAEYIFQGNNPQSFQLADDRIVVQLDGKWKLKTGSLFKGWSEMPVFSVENVILNGGIPVTID